MNATHNNTTTATTTAHFTMNAALLDDLLAGALIAAGKDQALPMLTCVNLSSDAGVITAAATDRYRLFIGKVKHATIEKDNPVETIDSFKINILREDINKIRNLIKPLTGKRAINPRVTFWMEQNKVTVNTIDGNVTFLAWDGNFPPYEHLIPSEFIPADEIGVNPSFLADLAKVPGIDKTIPLIIRTNGAAKPLLCETRAGDIQWQLLLMPMRVKA
jgi:DNA polymerase III sliding clamp (beta) subunit (PCNA family)